MSAVVGIDVGAYKHAAAVLGSINTSNSFDAVEQAMTSAR
jgi:hypothetical protein